MLVALVQATPATDRLTAAMDAIGEGPATATGNLVHAGHGPVPGATTEHPFAAAAEKEGTVFTGRWAGEGWSDAVRIERDRVLRNEGAGWSAVSEGEGAWLTVQLLASRPRLLMARLASEPARLRLVGDEVLWASAAGLATLGFDAGGRPASLRLPRAHPVFGDVVDEVRWSWTSDGPTTEIHRAEADTRWVATLAPGGVAPAPIRPPDAPARARTELAPGVFAIAVPEANSRTLLWISGDQGVLFDAPLSSAIGADLLALARELGPEVQSWSVVVSHHHPHQTGGLRPWVRAGATVYAPAAIEAWLEQALAGERQYDPADPPIRRAPVIGVARRLDLLGGAVQLRAIDGESGHTDAFLLAYLVEPRLLYVADLASWKEGAVAPRVRGSWTDKLRRWAPEQAVSAFPLEGTRHSWPWPPPSEEDPALGGVRRPAGG